MKRFHLLFIAALFLFACRQAPVPTEALPTSISTNTLLKDYVNTPDTAYQYELRNTIEGQGFKAYVLYLQSQRWLTEKEVKDPLWWHWLTVVVPDGAKGDMGLLSIGGGNRKAETPQQADPMVIQIAMATQSVVADLHNIPNQPMEFVGDDFGPRVEDELISYGWKQFIDGGGKDEDAIWLARMPMTKAAARAMDAIEDFSQQNLAQPIKRFTVMGGSKRGWATWTTALVDDRVEAIAPVVIDLLNVAPSFQHHWKAYGFWAPAVGDYVREGIMDQQDNPAYKRLMEIVEPYEFRDQLDLPKFLVNAAGDQFFIPDSWQFYYNDLEGEKHLRYVANADHSLGGSDAIQSLVAFYHAIRNEQARPTFDWKVDANQFQINSTTLPDSIWLWTASNDQKRDFRLESIGKAWQKRVIPVEEDGSYEVPISSPTKGWAAYFVEMQFPSEGPVPFKFSTGVKVLPEQLPFPAYGQAEK